MRIAIVCSRIGQDVARHRRIATLLCHCAIDTQRRRGTWLIARGSAIEAWARRAAHRFQIPVQWVVTEDGSRNDGDVCHSNRHLDRDAAVIEMADRIEAVFVRRRGRIERVISRRLAKKKDGQVRVAFWPGHQTAAETLVSAGAVGWFLRSESIEPDESLKLIGEPKVDPPLGQWLVHCTRGTAGAWPDETQDQYQDSMLAGDDGGSNRTPLDSLIRILQQRRLKVSAVSSSHQHPVVCFSAVPIDELLARRTFRSHLRRWDFEPFGIMIRTDAAQRQAIKPVIYTSPDQQEIVPATEQFRFHPKGKNDSWTVEREWRSPVDVCLDSFTADDVRVFALDRPSCRSKLQGIALQVIWVRDWVIRESDVDYIIGHSNVGRESSPSQTFS